MKKRTDYAGKRPYSGTSQRGSEGMVTPAGLRAWSKCMQRPEEEEEEKGYWGGIVGQYQSIPGVTEKGPPLHKIGKTDTPRCHCQNREQSRRHAVEGCVKLTEVRKKVESEEMEEWWMRHSRSRMKKEGGCGG